MEATQTAVDVAVTVDPKLDSAPDPNEVDHIACCRDFFNDGPWVAACGVEFKEEDFASFSEHECDACIAAVGQGLREVGSTKPYGTCCFKDGSDCPTGSEADDLSRRIVGLDKD